MTYQTNPLAPAALPTALAAALAAVLAATTLSGTLVFACMMPFAAIAAIAAVALPTRSALAAIALSWLGNQVLGFGLMGFPWDVPTAAAGLSLLASSLAAFAAARRGAGIGRGRALAVFVAGFVAYELSLFAYALAFGDLTMFAPGIVAAVAINDALWFAGLWLGWQVIERTARLAAWRTAE